MSENELTFPYVTKAQCERLDLLAEELCEVGQAIAKIKRHGFDSYNPYDPNVTSDKDGRMRPDNLDALQKEIGHVMNAVDLLVAFGDLVNLEITMGRIHKRAMFSKFLHHQPADALKNFVESGSRY